MITQDLLHELYIYEDGNLLRKKDGYRRQRKKGEVVGSPHSGGYIQTKINRKPYLVHRLIWLMFNDSIVGEIDHINRIKTDNRIENLRDVSHYENMQNVDYSARKTRSDKGIRRK